MWPEQSACNTHRHVTAHSVLPPTQGLTFLLPDMVKVLKYTLHPVKATSSPAIPATPAGAVNRTTLQALSLLTYRLDPGITVDQTLVRPVENSVSQTTQHSSAPIDAHQLTGVTFDLSCLRPRGKMQSDEVSDFYSSLHYSVITPLCPPPR